GCRMSKASASNALRTPRLRSASYISDRSDFGFAALIPVRQGTQLSPPPVPSSGSKQNALERRTEHEGAKSGHECSEHAAKPFPVGRPGRKRQERANPGRNPS